MHLQSVLHKYAIMCCKQVSIVSQPHWNSLLIQPTTISPVKHTVSSPYQLQVSTYTKTCPEPRNKRKLLLLILPNHLTALQRPRSALSEIGCFRDKRLQEFATFPNRECLEFCIELMFYPTPKIIPNNNLCRVFIFPVWAYLLF